MMQNVDVRNPLCESVTTNSYRAQRGKVFEGQFHHLGSESQVAHNIARVKTMKAMRGRIALQSTSCKMPLTLAPFRPAGGGLSGCVRVLASLLFAPWGLELRTPALISNVRFGLFRVELAAHHRRRPLCVCLPHPRRSPYNKSSFSSRAARDQRTSPDKCSGRRWPGQIPPTKNCIRKAPANGSIAQ